MSDLIRREDAIDAIVRQTNYDNVDVIKYECRRNYEKDNGWLGGLKEALEAVESLPERKKGKWLHNPNEYDDDTYECSRCGEPWTLIEGTPKENNMNYCPNCGANMRG